MSAGLSANMRLKLLTGIAGAILVFGLLLDDEEPAGTYQMVEPVLTSGSDNRPLSVAAEKLPVLSERELVSSSLNLFDRHSWRPAPAPRKAVKAKPRSAPPTKPVAPALPYNYMGTFTEEGQRTVYFLVRDNKVFEVAVGDVLEGKYSVDAVDHGQMQLTNLQFNVSQNLSVGGKR